MFGRDRLLGLIKSEHSDHHPFVLGGLFLDQTVPPSFVSLVLCKSSDSSSLGCKTLRLVKARRRGGSGFLSVSLSMKGNGSEGYVGESRESCGQNGNGKGGEEEVEETTVFKEEEKKEEEKKLGAFNSSKHLFSGAVAAAVSRTFIAPLERLKLEYIVRSEQKNLFELINKIAATEGLKGFWRGNFVNILRTAPFKSINFYAYDTYRNQLLKKTGNKEATNFERFVAGAAAGITASLICLPMDTGLVPSLASMAPSGAVFYGVYDILKSAYLQSPKGKKRLEDMKLGQELSALEQLELGPGRTLLYGAIAGACSEAATYPFEVVRRQLQMQVRATKLSALAICVKIVEQGGVPALYAGLVPSLLQVLPSAAISYLVYEFMKIVLKVESKQI